VEDLFPGQLLALPARECQRFANREPSEASATVQRPIASPTNTEETHGQDEFPIDGDDLFIVKESGIMGVIA
jgi:hypothetical protein